MRLRRTYLTVGCFIVLNLALLQLGPVGCGDCDLEITTTSLPNGALGVYYSFQLDSKCGGDDWYLVDGQLPPGLGLTQGGALRGTPTQRGVYNFVVEVIDFDNGWVDEIASAGLSLTVTNPPPPTFPALPTQSPSAGSD